MESHVLIKILFLSSGSFVFGLSQAALGDLDDLEGFTRHGPISKIFQMFFED